MIGASHALQVRQRRLQGGTRLRELLARRKTLSVGANTHWNSRNARSGFAQK